MDISQINESNVLNLETIRDLFNIENNFEREQISQALREIAKKNGKTKAFDNLISAYAKTFKKAPMEPGPQNITNCTDLPDGLSNIPCGPWIVDDNGIRKLSPDGTNIWACKHPIVLVSRLKNLQTGFELAKLAYKRDSSWQYLTVPVDVLANQTKIISLSKYGILVNSDNAKLLIRYINDLASAGAQYIPVHRSSSKLGWINNVFLPYDHDIQFDSQDKFSQLSEAIKEYGDEAKWMHCIRDIRQSSSFSVRMMMAASFASVLLERVDALPFFVDLWGDTENGKSVTLMICSSIWADPSNNNYIGDFKATDVALEAKANALNNLPLILDDTSKISARIRDNFEGFVYDLASGKGKSRSDIDLGIRYENNWKLITITSGESPLNSYVNQGGAINRILEIKADTRLFENPQGVVESIRTNYGFAGKKFIDAIKGMKDGDIKKYYKDIQQKVHDSEINAMQKQSNSLAVLLLADKIATDFIFRDGIYLNIKEAVQVLVDPAEISLNEKAYEYICSKVIMNPSKFNDINGVTEQWGFIDGHVAFIYVPAFSTLCEYGKINKKSFCDWAITNGVLVPDNRGCPTRAKKILNRVRKVYCLILPDMTED